MITPLLVERFLAVVHPESLRAGTRYADQARVGTFIGSAVSVTTLVRGVKGDHDLAMWSEGGALKHRCHCEFWRGPCKHAVAAALVLRQWITRPPEAPEKSKPRADSGKGASATKASRKSRHPQLDARSRAIEERRVAARRERLRVRLGESPPQLVVQSGSGFRHSVTLRGTADGPHGCDCPDFEANRLHDCKHVARVRAKLRTKQVALPAAWRAAAKRPRVYLRFGEVVEPWLHGRSWVVACAGSESPSTKRASRAVLWRPIPKHSPSGCAATARTWKRKRSIG